MMTIPQADSVRAHSRFINPSCDLSLPNLKACNLALLNLHIPPRPRPTPVSTPLLRTLPDPLIRRQSRLVLVRLSLPWAVLARSVRLCPGLAVSVALDPAKASAVRGRDADLPASVDSKHSAAAEV